MTALRNILAHPAIYRLWQAPFVRSKFAPIESSKHLARAQRVLDVGCGPGTNALAFRHCDYLGIDLNADYIKYASRRFPGRFLHGDVTHLSLDQETPFDFILANSLLHHLDDGQANGLLESLEKLLSPTGSVHILDLVLPQESGPARFLAQCDRGEFPRELDTWRNLFEQRFNLEAFEPYALTALGIPLWKMVYFRGGRTMEPSMTQPPHTPGETDA